MKRIPIFLMFLFALNLLHGQINIQNLRFNNESYKDKILRKSQIKLHSPKSVIWNWDTIVCYNGPNENDISFLITQQTDTMGRIISDETKRLNIQTWVNVERNTYTYDTAGYLISHLSQTKDNNNGGWREYLKITYINDKKGKPIFIKSERKNYDTWADESRENLLYDENSNLIELIEESYDNNSWKKIYKITYSYNAGMNLICSIMETWNNNNWVNSRKKIFSYNSLNQKTNEIGQIWNGAWVNNYINNYEYDAALNLVRETYQTCNSTSCFFTERYFNSYDSEGNLLTKTRQSWDMSGESWYDEDRSIYQYDGFGKSISGKDESWNGNIWYLSPSFGGLQLFVLKENKYVKYLYSNCRYKAHYVSLNAKNINNEPFTIYPNPAINFLRINRTEGLINQIKVINIQGKEVLTMILNPNESNYAINIETLTKGIYFLQLNTDKGIVNKKFIVIK